MFSLASITQRSLRDARQLLQMDTAWITTAGFVILSQPVLFPKAPSFLELSNQCWPDIDPRHEARSLMSSSNNPGYDY